MTYPTSIPHDLVGEDHCDGDSSPNDRDINNSSSLPPPPPPHLEWTDEEFKAHLHTELSKHPLSTEYPTLFQVAPKIICKWRQRYRGNAPLWKRLFQKDRVLKEFIEAVPIIDAVQRLIVTPPPGADNDDETTGTDNTTHHVTDHRNEEKYTILDLACGRGYLSMILSELLPPDRVEKIMLIDKAWAMHNVAPESHHISSAHIYGPVITTDLELDYIPDADDVIQEPHHTKSSSGIPCTYYNTWPIPLNTTKVNLKKSKEISNMERRLFNNNNNTERGNGDGSGGGPIILLAVHLCGTLSLKAVELFNNNPNTVLFCLKPCCLPGIVHAKRDEIFHLGDHSFDSKLVCMTGKWNKNVWKGPCRTLTKTYFDRWAENLYLGIMDHNVAADTAAANDDKGNDDGAASAGVTKVRMTIPIQLNGGYQNEFLFAERHRRGQR